MRREHARRCRASVAAVVCSTVHQVCRVWSIAPVTTHLAVDVEGVEGKALSAALQPVKHREQLPAHANLLLQLGRQVQACCSHALW